MKNIIFIALILIGLHAYSQNTIPTTTVNGALSVNNETRMLDTVRADKDIKIAGNAEVGGKLRVHGKSTFKNDIIIKKSILMDNNNEFSYIPSTSSTRETFYLGNTNAKVLPYFYTCQNPNNNASPIFLNNGSYVARTPLGSGTGQTNSSITMYSAPWDGSGIIEVEGVDNNGAGNNGLLINFFCGRNTNINTGWDLSPSTYKDGGTVFLGAKVDMQKSLKIGYSSNGVDLNTALEINQNDNNANGAKVITYNNGVKAFSVYNSGSSFNKNTFVVYGDGRTHIGTEKVIGQNSDALLSVSGKVACKSLYVLKPTTWADDVFKKKEIESLKNVEKYINSNKHLPDMPSEAEILENGYDINEMDAKLLSKIERLYLHIIELEKEIDNLKSRLNK